MQNKQENFSMQDAMRLANSSAGKELLALLKENSDGTVEQARKQAEQGDFGQVKKTLSALMQNPKVQELLEEMRKGNG